MKRRADDLPASMFILSGVCSFIMKVVSSSHDNCHRTSLREYRVH